MPKKVPKIYLIHCEVIDLYKIGISVNPDKRLKQLQTGSPYEMNIISIFESKHPFKTEKIIHNSLKSKKAPENFEFDFKHLKGEWFNLNVSDVLSFQSICKGIEERFEILKKSGNPFV
jgi:hypothetical protein